MKNQQFLRKQVKVAKALNDDWSFKEMSQVIDISVNSFYNWLNGAYELSESKKKQLQNLVNDLLD